MKFVVSYFNYRTEIDRCEVEVEANDEFEAHLKVRDTAGKLDTVPGVGRSVVMQTTIGSATRMVRDVKPKE
jgi:hypothetical protein